MKVADFNKRIVSIANKNFKGGYMCSYMFKFPLDARPGDKIEAKVTRIKQLRLYVAEGKDLFDAKGTKVVLKKPKRGF